MCPDDLSLKCCLGYFISRGKYCYTIHVALHNDCQINVPLYKRYFVTTTYAAIPYFGTKIWKAV